MRTIINDQLRCSFEVFGAKAVGETIKYGDNCVPDFEAEQVDELHDQLATEGITIVVPLNNVNGTRIFQCRDSEGNLPEFYQWIKE